jgi:hypothetical protein
VGLLLIGGVRKVQRRRAQSRSDLAEGIETLLPCLPTVLTLAGLTIDRKARLHGGQCAAEDRHCDGLNTELRSTPTTAIQVLGMGR